MIPRLWAIGLLGIPFALWADPVTVPAGPFQMGCSRGDIHCEQDEGPQGGIKVDVPAFRIDSREVTVAEYRGCILDGGCEPPLTHVRNKYCNFDAPERDDHPVNCLDWAQAAAFCAWRGGRLPWEAEWEKAARAGSSSPYPWGDEIDCRRAVLDDGTTLGSAGAEPDGCGEDRTWPVGSCPANAMMLFDMHGNVGEWIGNWYHPDAIAQIYAAGDLEGPPSGKRRVTRGGSWDETGATLRSSFRNTKRPTQGDAIYGSIGFRCVYPPE